MECDVEADDINACIFVQLPQYFVIPAQLTHSNFSALEISLFRDVEFSFIVYEFTEVSCYFLFYILQPSIFYSRLFNFDKATV